MQSNKIHTPATRNCKYPVEGRTDGEGYYKGNESHQGVIVIQEWWGLNQNMMDVTDLFASQGFQAISPDIYRGKVAQDREEAGHLFHGLDWDGAVKDIEGAAKFLREKGCKKVGVLGFCMGGALAIAAFSQTKNIDAAAPFYGVCDLTKYKLDNIPGPIYGHFGEKDEAKGFASPADAQRLVDEGKKVNKDVKVKIWPDVGHAFMNQERPEAYKAETAKLALEDVTKFFKETFAK